MSGPPPRVHPGAVPSAASAASSKRKRVVRPQECSKVCDEGDEDGAPAASVRAAPRAKHARVSLASLTSPRGGDDSVQQEVGLFYTFFIALDIMRILLTI